MRSRKLNCNGLMGERGKEMLLLFVTSLFSGSPFLRGVQA